MADSNVKQFDTTLKQIKARLKKADFDGAASQYNELKKQYSAIMQSEAKMAAKKAAYRKVSSAYNLIVSAKQKAGKTQDVKKEVKKEENQLLGEAIRDLERQIGQLSEEKHKKEAYLSNVKGQMAKVQNEESALRDKISALVAQEAVLNTKRLHTVEEITQLKDKITDMAKIKEELRTM